MDLPHEMVESSAPSLEIVSLVGLRSLKNLPMVIDCLPKSARLKELIIVGVPKFMASSRIESWPFRSLRILEIDVSMEWSREASDAIKETVDGILQGCSNSLIWLNLRGLEMWECLPESIQHLTAHSFLWLTNFGIEELPEWFENLSSLEGLYLSSCKKLRRLPSMDAMHRLTKLQKLSIQDCPQLCIESEWHKISHIPMIWLDDRRIPSHDQ